MMRSRGLGDGVIDTCRLCDWSFQRACSTMRRLLKRWSGVSSRVWGGLRWKVLVRCCLQLDQLYKVRFRVLLPLFLLVWKFHISLRCKLPFRISEQLHNVHVPFVPNTQLTSFFVFAVLISIAQYKFSMLYYIWPHLDPSSYSRYPLPKQMHCFDFILLPVMYPIPQQLPILSLPRHHHVYSGATFQYMTTLDQSDRGMYPQSLLLQN
jgi:hypothetical protein